MLSLRNPALARKRQGPPESKSDFQISVKWTIFVHCVLSRDFTGIPQNMHITTKSAEALAFENGVILTPKWHVSKFHRLKTCGFPERFHFYYAAVHVRICNVSLKEAKEKSRYARIVTDLRFQLSSMEPERKRCQGHVWENRHVPLSLARLSAGCWLTYGGVS